MTPTRTLGPDHPSHPCRWQQYRDTHITIRFHAAATIPTTLQLHFAACFWSRVGSIRQTDPVTKPTSFFFCGDQPPQIKSRAPGVKLRFLFFFSPSCGWHNLKISPVLLESFNQWITSQRQLCPRSILIARRTPTIDFVLVARLSRFGDRTLQEPEFA